jgi:hypothetical protein
MPTNHQLFAYLILTKESTLFFDGFQQPRITNYNTPHMANICLCFLIAKFYPFGALIQRFFFVSPSIKQSYFWRLLTKNHRVRAVLA